MKLARVEIKNFRAIARLDLNFRAIERLDQRLNSNLIVLHGDNGHGKTSVLSAIAVGLSDAATLLPGVSGIRFHKNNLRWNEKKTYFPPLRIAMTTKDDIEWERRRTVRQARATITRQELKKEIDAILEAEWERSQSRNLPIFAFYDTDRAMPGIKLREHDLKTEFPRYEALEGALSPRIDFREFLHWFYAKENKELRIQKRRPNPSHGLKELDTIRRAIEGMVPGVSDPRIEPEPLRFVVSVKLESGKSKELELDQLGGGYRIMLALAADLARRMAQGNSHLDDPLESEAVVLIDEIELHLHPAWQQRVLDDLTRTFPNTQFIVSTHSPQVLTTVYPEQVVELRREDENIVAVSASAPTYGAEAGDVLFTVMGVDERPDNEFARKLDEYMRYVEDGQGECENAVRLKRRLVELSPDALEIHEAGIEIERHKLVEKLAESR